MEDARSDIVLSYQVKDVVSWTALFKRVYMPIEAQTKEKWNSPRH